MEGSRRGCHMLLGDSATMLRAPETEERCQQDQIGSFNYTAMSLQCKGAPVRIDEPWLIESFTGYEVIFYK